MALADAQSMAERFAELIPPGSVDAVTPHEGAHIAEWMGRFNDEEMYTPLLFAALGPRGSGKRFITEYYASVFGLNMLVVPENTYTGGNAFFINSLFERAKANAPCVLYFDYAEHLYSNGKMVAHRGFEADQVRNEMLKLRAEDRVWVTLASDVSPMMLLPSLQKCLSEMGMIGLVRGTIPGEMREQFARKKLSDLTKITPGRIPWKALDWIVKYSEYATFRSIYNFINDVITYTHGSAPKHRRRNNEMIFSENALVNAIETLMPRHKFKDRSTGVVCEEMSIAQWGNGSRVLAQWPECFRMAVESRISRSVPSEYIEKNEDAEDAIYDPHSNYNFSDDDDDEEEDDSPTSPKPAPTPEELERKLDNMQNSPLLANLWKSNQMPKPRDPEEYQRRRRLVSSMPEVERSPASSSSTSSSSSSLEMTCPTSPIIEPIVEKEEPRKENTKRAREVKPPPATQEPHNTGPSLPEPKKRQRLCANLTMFPF